MALCPDCWHEIDQHAQSGCLVFWVRRTKAGIVRTNCKCKRPAIHLVEDIEVGLMDDINKETAPGSSSAFLKGDDKDTLVVTKQPFNVRGVRFRVNSKYTDNKTGQPRQEWLLDLRFLDTSGNVAEIDDGEGNAAPVDRTLTLTNTEARSKVMPRLKTAVEAALAGGQEDGIGPFYLYKQKVQGQANPAYTIGDWPPNAANEAATASAPPPPPPTPELISPDGKWRWDGANWVPNTPPPPPPPDVVPANVAAPGTVLPFSSAPASNLPEPGKSQPLPRTVETITGGDGEGGMVSVTRTKGDEIRQVIYREDGVIQTPSGGLVQAASPEPPAPIAGTGAIMSPDGKFYLDNGKWVKLPPLPTEHQEAEPEITPQIVPASQAREQAQAADAEARGIAPEPPPPPAPIPIPPPPTSPPEAASVTGKQRKTIPMEGVCDTCGKKVRGSAFKNSKERWILTHTCSAPDPNRPGNVIGSKTIDVHDRVVAILQEVTS